MRWGGLLLAALVGVAVAGCGGPAGDDAAARCVRTDLVISVAQAPDLQVEESALVQSSEHAHLWFLASRLVNSRVAVWALDDPAALSWAVTVNDVAKGLTPQLPDVADVAAPKPPELWSTSKGELKPGSWRSVTVGVTEFTDGAREAWQCVRWDSLYRDR
jgi:hypothetical protein